MKPKMFSLLLFLFLCLALFPTALAAEPVYTEEGYTAEEYLYPHGGQRVVLQWKPLSSEEDTRDYELWLLTYHKNEKLLLPSTLLTNGGYAPTHRPPRFPVSQGRLQDPCLYLRL